MKTHNVGTLEQRLEPVDALSPEWD